MQNKKFLDSNKKVRQPKSTHRKTQTPIVATQTKLELGYHSHTHFSGVYGFTNPQKSMRK